jgi:hypothetical protein
VAAYRDAKRPDDFEAHSIPRTFYTPAGQHLVIERENDMWVVRCDDLEPVKHRHLDVALIEALRKDVNAQWGEFEPGRFTRLIADVISSDWEEQG